MVEISDMRQIDIGNKFFCWEMSHGKVPESDQRISSQRISSKIHTQIPIFTKIDLGFCFHKILLEVILDYNQNFCI